MTPEQAKQVVEALRRGASFSYTSYAAEARFTYAYDAERGQFTLREQPAYSGPESTEVIDEARVLQALQSFSFEEAKGLL